MEFDEIISELGLNGLKGLNTAPDKALRLSPKRLISPDSEEASGLISPARLSLQAAPDKEIRPIRPFSPAKGKNESEVPGYIHQPGGNGNATPEQQAKLSRLVAAVCREYQFTDAEIEEAKAKALADYKEAVICYMELAHKAGILKTKGKAGYAP